MSFEDRFSGHASKYALYRPAYPQALFEFLASTVENRRLVWDCATGNGQAALGLADWFDHVIASDASTHQIEQAFSHPKVRYEVFPAERPALEDASVDLITVAQALHWFDLDRFYGEAKRVLTPDGVIAAWCYRRCHILPAIDELLVYLDDELLKPYWSPKVRWVHDHYRSIPFPFVDVAAPEFVGETLWSLEQLLGYLSSWSAVQEYTRQHDASPLDEIRPAMEAAWGTAGKRRIHWPFYLRVGSRPTTSCR